MALPKKKSRPGLMIAIGVGKKPQAGDDLPGPRPVDDQDEDDTPGGGVPDHQEPDADDQTAQCEPDPEAVCFRSEQETCQYCDYMQGPRCTHPIVAMPVNKGDSCNAFRPKQGGGEEQAPPAGGGEYAGDGQEPVGEQS